MTERRQEVRRAAEGVIELQVETPPCKSLVGTLVDASNSGLRVQHGDISLTTGNRVRYSYAGGAGIATVMWTRVFDGKVESGLYTGSAG